MKNFIKNIKNLFYLYIFGGVTFVATLGLFRALCMIVNSNVQR